MAKTDAKRKRPILNKIRRFFQRLLRIPMDEPEDDNVPENQEPVGRSEPELGQVITALQKSFSRVSAAAAARPPEKARALVVGQVDFEMSLKCDVEGKDNDYLRVHARGSINLKLAGTIDVDVREVEESELQRGEFDDDGGEEEEEASD